MTAVFHYLLFISFCCPFVLHLVELSSQLLTGDKAHSSAQNLPKINSPEIWVTARCMLLERHWVIFFSFVLLERGGLCFLPAFAQIPELNFAFMIQSSSKQIIPLINVNFGSQPSCLKVELIRLFNIWNGGMLTWMFLIFPWKLF